jgi:hypothetical protein
MRKWWYAALAVSACVAVVSVTVALSRREKEPTYQGQPLSYWVLRSMGDDGDREMAAEAFRHIGTNAVPFLLQWTRYERPAWRMKVVVALRRMPRPVHRLIASRIISRTEWLSEGAVNVFTALGTNGASAVPDLTPLMRNTNAPRIAMRAIIDLAFVGTNSLPVLLSAAEDRQFPFRYTARYAMARFMPTNAGVNDVIGSALMRWLSDTNDPETIGEAAIGLGDRRYNPEVCVPAILDCLASAGTNQSRRAEVIAGLWRYGASAVQALPALTNALSDPSPSVTAVASNAIKAITLEASKSGGGKR